MVLQRAERIVETTTTQGTGTYELDGPRKGFQSFFSRIASGNTVEYCATDGVDFEIGIGTFTDASPDTLARTTVLTSSNGDVAIDWGVGTRNIFLSALASRFVPGLINQIAFNTAEGVLGSNSDLLYDGSDLVLRGKMDIGAPGSIQGLDIGEGGSYFTDKDGNTIVRAFTYDASAASGSRFTELTDLDANNQLLGDAGDRIYIGSTSKYWAMRFQVGIANTVSTETFLGFYWDGSALRAATIMGILKDSSMSLADRVLEQTLDQEYITFDKAIDADWTAVDNQLDEIPNADDDFFWFALQVPASGLTTAPRVDEIRVRGTDADFVTGTAHQVHWGKARVGKTSSVAAFVDRSSNQPQVTDFDISANVITPVFTLRNNQEDGVDLTFHIPSGTDTSSKLGVQLDWFSDAAGDVEFDLHFKITKQGTVLGSGESDTTVTTIVTPSGASQMQVGSEMLLPADFIDISACMPGDEIFFTLVRDGNSDANTGDVFPVELDIDYTEFTLGELV